MLPPTPEEVAAIVAMDDRPVIRNLLTTQSYHRLTLAMADVFGRDHLLWPVFATWASKQAGAFIRGDALTGPIAPILAAVPESTPGRAGLVRLLDGVVADVSRHIIGGNVIVFEELGELFARLYLAFADPGARTEERLADLVARYAEGPSAPDTVTRAADGALIRVKHGGQGLVREAIATYFAALHTRDRDARAELILLANALCGLHEQTRLHPYIRGALDGPVEQLLGDVLEEHQALARRGAALVRRAATELMMTIELPGQVLRLGADLPPPPGRPLWPAALADLQNPRLLEITAQLGVYEARERVIGGLDRVQARLQGLVGLEEAQGTGAEDWSSLADRMRYIFEYFRSRQADERLLTPPFTGLQVAAFARGRVPVGPL